MGFHFVSLSSFLHHDLWCDALSHWYIYVMPMRNIYIYYVVILTISNVIHWCTPVIFQVSRYLSVSHMFFALGAVLFSGVCNMSIVIS